ncbi:hypothetical protein SAMN05518849_101573 [Sphingobium sp. AP50]|uniref:helix-turn-helix domain-containing protein n=1 Tax=Sphingobium sp. AP50 TaxID=1884369 RepID=UPI0008B96BCA|nr:helix-turn-helix transcriptional regulator [Sphingobium sp. AP50]SEI69165.1 hypothetical protein SAMN05518849_101573 [Sphingobium sp. AP50]
MMSPGTYLNKRRVAAGLSIIDVAALVNTSPRLGGIDKVAWIDRIEKDIAALSPDVVAALSDVFRFSRRVLEQLITIRSYGPSAVQHAPQLCLICGCSQNDACFTGEATCGWASDDVCTACAPKSLSIKES